MGLAFGFVLVSTPAANSMFWLSSSSSPSFHFSSIQPVTDSIYPFSVLLLSMASIICGQLRSGSIKWKNPGIKSSCTWSDGWVG